MKLKRYNMKKLLADPKIRRELIIQGTIATQAREGIVITREEAETSYDEVMKEKRTLLRRSYERKTHPR